MTNTKQRILSQALLLFNKNSIPHVSLRDIATEANISVGNLQYHFKKREDVIEALYHELVEKINQHFDIKDENLLKVFFNKANAMMKILFEYRFFFLNFVTIIRNNESIKTHYRNLSKQREAESLQIIDLLINHGLLKKQALKNEYQILFKKIELVSNFWFSAALIKGDKLSKKSISEYSLLVSYTIYPYLTSKGKKTYCEIFPQQIQ